MTKTQPLSYRKTRTGEWVAFGPADALPAMSEDHKPRGNGPVITITLKGGRTEQRRVEKYGRPFQVDGIDCRYAYLAPREGDHIDRAPAPLRPGATGDPLATDIPDGYYAVRSATGNNDRDFYAVERGTRGQWAGRVFVRRVIGGKPDINVRRAEAISALERIAEAGPEAAGAEYAEHIGNCWKCNIHLTDDISRALRIGPDCCRNYLGETQKARLAHDTEAQARYAALTAAA